MWEIIQLRENTWNWKKVHEEHISLNIWVFFVKVSQESMLGNPKMTFSLLTSARGKEETPQAIVGRQGTPGRETCAGGEVRGRWRSLSSAGELNQAAEEARHF